MPFTAAFTLQILGGSKLSNMNHLYCLGLWVIHYSLSLCLYIDLHLKHRDLKVLKQQGGKWVLNFHKIRKWQSNSKIGFRPHIQHTLDKLLSNFPVLVLVWCLFLQCHWNTSTQTRASKPLCSINCQFLSKNAAIRRLQSFLSVPSKLRRCTADNTYWAHSNHTSQGQMDNCFGYTRRTTCTNLKLQELCCFPKSRHTKVESW